jgi:processive 1,2-diacylglycerol beta-glucosyltransferase
LTRGVLAKHNIRKEQIEVIGLPVHPAFLEKKDPLFIREEFSIPAGKPVVLLMMGGAGGKRAIEYAEKLRDIKLPIHVVICTGNNHALYQKMLSLTKEQKEVSFSILSFTNRIADLMQVADLLITKPGPGTINEAMLRQLPILVDNASSTLVWERVNQELVEEMGIGQVLHTIEDLKEPVAKYLLDTAVISRVANAYRSICLPSFFDHIVRVVESLLDPVYRR